jgi:NAD(P)-dependent dehydrogenase (short-subunit alcohol dehydrogenase family)
MAATLKPVSQQVIVITGASSGIGRATAKAAAKKDTSGGGVAHARGRGGSYGGSNCIRAPRQLVDEM